MRVRSEAGIKEWEEHVDGLIYALLGKTASLPAIVGPMATFVFQPGGVQSGNVFTTWAALMAAVALSPGNRIIRVDDSLAVANTSAGTFDIEGVYFTSKKTGTTTLHVIEGTLFTATRFIVDDSLTISNDVTATVPMVSSAAVNPLLRPQFRGSSTLKSTGGIAFFQKSAGGSLTVLMIDGAVLGSAAVGQPVITIDGGQSATVTAVATSNVTAHAVAGAGTLTALVDASSRIGAQDAGVTNTTNVDLAAQVAYTPGTAGNWNPAPTLASAALDQLAASNFKNAATNTGTGTGTVTAGPTANITKAKSGAILVIATLAGESTGPGTITGQLVRDAGTNIGSPAAVTALSANDDFSMTLVFVDTAPDAAAHTYKATFTASAGNITAAATSAQIVAVEL